MRGATSGSLQGAPGHFCLGLLAVAAESRKASFAEHPLFLQLHLHCNVHKVRQGFEVCEAYMDKSVPMSCPGAIAASQVSQIPIYSINQVILAS